ncbi:MAG: hypothetical protein V1779_10930 [bacterium]
MKSIGIGSLIGILFCFVVFYYFIEPKTTGGIALVIIICFGLSSLVTKMALIIYKKISKGAKQ